MVCLNKSFIVLTVSNRKGTNPNNVLLFSRLSLYFSYPTITLKRLVTRTAHVKGHSLVCELVKCLVWTKLLLKLKRSERLLGCYSFLSRTEGSNSHSCSWPWALRGGQWHRKWWFSRWFWPWWIEKLKVTNINFSHLMSFLKFYKKNKFAMIDNWKFCCRHPPPPTPTICPFSWNILLFKENLSELQPCLANWYLVSKNIARKQRFCSFLKVSWRSMPPPPSPRPAL